MTEQINIQDREPVWVALSDFYLDNELQEYDFNRIATKIIESPYTFEEIKEIDKQEIFPVLYSNLLSVAGVWSGFQEDHLILTIMKSLRKRTFLKRIRNRLTYRNLKWMYSDYWNTLERTYLELREK